MLKRREALGMGVSIKGVTTGAANWAPGKVSRERITPVHGTNE